MKQCSTECFAAGLFRTFDMLMNIDFSSWGGCAGEPTWGKVALRRASKSTMVTGVLEPENYLFKDLGNCMRLEKEVCWILNTKSKSIKLELINAALSGKYKL